MTTATRTRRPNTYAGTCSNCGTRVAAQAGLLGPKVNGRWTVEHSECPTQTLAPLADRWIDASALNYGRRPAVSAEYAECEEGHRRHVRGCFACENQIGF